MVICFANRKGGTGKTSTAGNVAFELSRKRTTLLIDADSQGSLTEWLVHDQPQAELADVLMEQADAIEACHPITDKLFILPTFADGDLRDYTEQRALREPFAAADLFGKLVERFDHIIVDLPPGLNTFEQSVLASCDRAIPVLEPEALAVRGLNDLMGDLEEIRRKRRSAVSLNWLVINKVNKGFRRHEIYRSALADQWEGFRLFEIPQSAAVSEAQTMNAALSGYNAKESRALPKYRELAEALMEVSTYAKA